MARSKLIAAIVVAAGTGERARTEWEAVPKQYRVVAGIPILSRAVAALLAADAVTYVLPVIHPDHAQHFAALGLADPRLLAPVIGRSSRQASVLAGLEALAPLRPALVLIHDAARPFAGPEVIAGVIAALEGNDAVVPAVPVTDTIKRAPDGHTVVATEDRATLFAAQTPQGFRFPQILSAHLRAARLPRTFTDDAAIAEWAGLGVALSPGSTANVKVTRPEDFAAAERALTQGAAMETRIGTGFDVHPFEPGEAVWLGGVRILHTHGLTGHSDADVLLHALTDAIYGALGEGDIGVHFPPTDPQWRGAASSLFLAHAAGLVTARGGRIVNLDATLVCEGPRIGPHVPAMREAIASACAISPARVTVKATTSERLGFTGRGEGIVAMASASIELPRAP